MEIFGLIYNVFILCAFVALFWRLKLGLALLLLAFSPAVLYGLYLPREDYHMLFERVDPYGGMWVTFWLGVVGMLYFTGWFRKELIA